MRITLRCDSPAMQAVQLQYTATTTAHRGAAPLLACRTFRPVRCDSSFSRHIIHSSSNKPLFTSPFNPPHRSRAASTAAASYSVATASTAMAAGMDPLAAGVLAAGMAAAGLLLLFTKADCNLGLWWRSKPPAAAFKDKVVWITGATWQPWSCLFELQVDVAAWLCFVLMPPPVLQVPAKALARCCRFIWQLRGHTWCCQHVARTSWR
jgi:hypothetical protein